jgi:TfoX/Sxy family transcriptional regulator of competence genes
MEKPMAYDESLALRIRTALSALPGVTETKMFGGISFLVDGNMAGGVSKDNLMVRIGPDVRDAALAQPHVRVFDMTGRPMKNWILVEPAGVQTDDDLKHWIDQGVAYAQSLPPK